MAAEGQILMTTKKSEQGTISDMELWLIKNRFVGKGKSSAIKTEIKPEVEDESSDSDGA